MHGRSADGGGGKGIIHTRLKNSEKNLKKYTFVFPALPGPQTFPSGDEVNLLFYVARDTRRILDDRPPGNPHAKCNHIPLSQVLQPHKPSTQEIQQWEPWAGSRTRTSMWSMGDPRGTTAALAGGGRREAPSWGPPPPTLPDRGGVWGFWTGLSEYRGKGPESQGQRKSSSG